KKLRLPTDLFGMPVDVVAVGKLRLASPAVTFSPPVSKIRPMVGGISTSGKESGTLGYFCKDGGCRWYALSCAHVYGPAKGAVLQPESPVGKKPDDQIAEVTKRARTEFVDAAIALIDAPAIGALNGLAAPIGVGAAVCGQRV